MPSVPDASDPSALSFEEILEQLEGVVATLESGDAPLEAALATFERGVALSRVGNRRLDDAERRIEQLLSNGETAALETETAGKTSRPRSAPKKRSAPRRATTEGNSDE